MRRTPIGLATVRGAWWAARALRRARRLVASHDLSVTSLPRPPRVGSQAVRGVLAVLRRRDHTCLMRAMVLQRWHLAFGDRRDLVIGVALDGPQFRAHAWLAGDPVPPGFVELARRPESASP